MKFTKTLIFCFSSLLFSFYGFAQDAIVKGKVVDENGLLVPGATVALKGTKAATTSALACRPAGTTAAAGRLCHRCWRTPLWTRPQPT